MALTLFLDRGNEIHDLSRVHIRIQNRDAVIIQIVYLLVQLHRLSRIRSLLDALIQHLHEVRLIETHIEIKSRRESRNRLKRILAARMLDRVAEQAPRHRQDLSVAVPDRRDACREDDRVTFRQECQIVVPDDTFFLRTDRIRHLALNVQSFDKTLSILSHRLRVSHRTVASTRHLGQRLNHRVVRRLQEHDISHVTLDDLVYTVAIHVSGLLQRLKNQRELLLLTQTNRQHSLETSDTMTLGLQVTELVEHEARLVERLLVRLCHVRLVEVQIHQLLHKNQYELRVLHQVGWRHQEHSLRLLRVTNRRQDNRRDILSYSLEAPRLIQQTCCRITQVTRNKNPVLTLHHLHENAITDDFVTRDRILDELTTIQRELVTLRELEVERFEQHAGMRVEQTQSQVCDIVRELPIKVVARPAFSHHCVFVLKVFPEVVCQLGIIKRIPLRLSTNETITLGEVLSKTHTEATRERQTAKICVLRRSTRGQRRDRRISEERHCRNGNTVHRRKHLLGSRHCTQRIVRVSDQRTHRRLRQCLSGVEEQREQVRFRLAFPQKLDALSLHLIVLDQSVDFIRSRRLLIVVAALNTLVHLSHRRLTLLRSELHEQLVAVVERDLAPHGIKLLLQNLLIHAMSHRVLTQLVLFFQVVIDQAVCCTLERVVCSIRPHRVFCAVHREEHVCDVFNVERTLGLIAFASSFGSHSKRVVDVSLHRVDEVELHNLESAHGSADVVLHQELALRIIDDHVIGALLTHPDVKHRLNVRLTLTSTSHSQDHGVRRSRIHVVDASRPLRLIRWKFPLAVHQIRQGVETLELVSVGIAWVVRHVSRIKTATELLVIRQS